MATLASDAGIAVISEEAARRELWISFGSLVRAYVAAAQIGSEGPQVVTLITESELILTGSAHTVRLEFDGGEGRGWWAIYRWPATSDETLLDQGLFSIGLDGLVKWSGSPTRQEMDAVAESLATLVTE